MNDRLERALLAEFPDEIEHVWTRLGTAEVATDPMGIELTDFFIALKPRERWKRAGTQRELIEQMRTVFGRVPGMTAAFSQPIEMRMNEMIAGVRGDVAVKVYGDDLETLASLSDRIQQVLSGIEGATEVSGEQMTDTTLVKNQACWACPIACTRVTKTDKSEGEGPEYETTWAFGARCGIDQLELIAEANYFATIWGWIRSLRVIPSAALWNWLNVDWCLSEQNGASLIWRPR